MKTNKRSALIWVLTLALLLCLCLTACGGDDADGADTAQGTAAQTTDGGTVSDTSPEVTSAPIEEYTGAGIGDNDMDITVDASEW